jgi:hypothetical protein
MNNRPRWLVLSCFLGLALACYFVGFIPGFGFFLILGIAFEGTFWVKLFSRDKSKPKTNDSNKQGQDRPD